MLDLSKGAPFYSGFPSMAGGGPGGGSSFSPPVQSQGVPSGSEAFFLSGSNRFIGARAMLSFEDVHSGGAKSGRPFFRSLDHDETMENDLDEYLHQPEKKRRLMADQVQFLEKSFELDNKLEPERKVQLAKDLGLQPRQVAIWFQNRRARWKTKQLEKDYDALQDSYNTLKANYDVLIKERDELKDQVHNLTDKLQIMGKQGETSCFQRQAPEGIDQMPIVESVSNEVTNMPIILPSKHDEICSAKSDVLDSDSSHYADGGQSPLLEPGDASYVLEPDQSDISQDEEDNLSMNLLPTYMLYPKLESDDFADTPAINSSPFGFSAEDHAFWAWPY